MHKLGDNVPGRKPTAGENPVKLYIAGLSAIALALGAPLPGFAQDNATQMAEYAALRSAFTTACASQIARSGPILFAGEHLSDEWAGFMNGAAQTGRLAAETIIAES